QTLGAKVTVCAPTTLIPSQMESLGVSISYHPDEVLPGADAVMVLRIQRERQDESLLPSMSEYSRFWGLTAEREKLLKKDAIVLHPGPINRGIEIGPLVADGPRSVILEQVTNGVFIRMAVLALV